MTFAGRATFAAGPQAPSGLVWRELGALTVAERTTTARRTLLLLAEHEAPGVLQVRFEDGRPFHRLAFDADGRAVAEHPCAADHYAGVYEIETDDRLTVTWRVTGPAKDATIVSRYARAA